MDNDVALLVAFGLLYLHIHQTSALYRRHEIGATHHPVDAYLESHSVSVFGTCGWMTR